MEKFYFVKSDSCEFWAQLEHDSEHGEIWRNMQGGWCPKSYCKIIKVEEFKSYDDFENSHRKEIYDYLIESDSPFGWLSPSGEFYGCNYAHHQDVAIFYFGKEDELELEKEGFVKVFADFSCGSSGMGLPVYAQSKMTEQQRESGLKITMLVVQCIFKGE